MGHATDTSFVLLPPFASRRDAGWTARLSPDALAEPPERRTAMALWEDDRRLGPGNAMEADICALGRGRYAVWPNEVCFSTSDGSNPNTNGRRYSLLLRSILKSALARRPDQPTETPAEMPAEMRWVPPERPFRRALLGTGARGISIARSLTRLAGIELRWLVDQSEERLELCRERLRNPKIELATDAERAITDPGVDAVFITVPDFLHRP